MIENELSGETGANPVRARRREALLYCVDLTGSHISGQAIGESLRRPVIIVPSRNIRTRESSYISDRERRYGRGNNN